MPDCISIRLKSELRLAYRTQRSGLAASERRRQNTAINQYVQEQVIQRGCRNIAAYLAFDGEPDIGPALAALRTHGVQLALPVLEAAARAGMVMRQWPASSDLQANRFGIAEPSGQAEIPLAEIDLVLMPLVGWDDQGNRLGMGAGYYDRLLHPLRTAKKPLRVGVAYTAQQVAAIPAGPLDVPLHALISEQGWTEFESQRQTQAD